MKDMNCCPKKTEKRVGTILNMPQPFLIFLLPPIFWNSINLFLSQQKLEQQSFDLAIVATQNFCILFLQLLIQVWSTFLRELMKYNGKRYQLILEQVGYSFQIL
eukprot:TRINITY_DN34567_c0_g1_i3.p9 TRINITY_DN34567_c0_g1~~TRINITY_DN34567_c0_g1_i3.p9  ORF type:complete len:104 (+),score=1.14 TRINITY_DN34567_c0_g1_i3:1537-1848(+)